MFLIPKEAKQGVPMNKYALTNVIVPALIAER